ncbi:TetR/AcrR family transcriptional regulator [Denitromonas iodatirespirans]|uniref:TetR/AcrR family transcriptional regulator n=1 Tax=Denitromonas iodatirespirans TaxID=2795389 RepID=A0A944HAV0_DENI1|nr:TetR/AcrR family transcriptional regulator [Denitromonas iodatirespirans]MBT0959726.1 TetR/AcrR family transcriptional regulator [Denitromonas iodatirespirans]
MNKGERTRQTILDAAVAMACEAGFESLSIGALADRVGMSKSGLFAHFGSREDLQIAAIEAAAARFSDLVFLPALKAPRGVPRLEALLANWLTWVERGGWGGGCPLQSAALEFDDKPGPVRDVVIAHYRQLERELTRTASLAVEQGEFRTDLDLGKFVFDMLGIVFATYYRRRLLGDSGTRALAQASFGELIERSRAHPVTH